VTTTLRTLDLRLPDGRRLRAYDSGPDVGYVGVGPADGARAEASSAGAGSAVTDDSDHPDATPGSPGLVAVWCHGTPNLGMPPEPLMRVARESGLRWVGYDRPGYGGSDARPGRTVASAGGDVEVVLDALGAERCVVVGHSGGGPHALAAAAALPDRVAAAVVLSGLAPRDAPGLDWYAGMSSAGRAVLASAERGRADRLAFVEPDDADPVFVLRDLQALDGPWSWFMTVVRPALAGDPSGAADDDIAYVTPWGFDVDAVRAPVLLVHGGSDLIAPLPHARWLADHLPDAELWAEPRDGHISVLHRGDDAVRWAARTAGVLPAEAARS
jgi:pimeloyl-ACP methyl ester carboxylesterase